MSTPETFIAYASPAGLRGSHASGYFLLEDFFHANAPNRYEAVDSGALHSDWSLDEPRRHELARMQEVFAREWLSFAEGRVTRARP